MSPRIVLVGPPGAGKTTIGKLLARRLGVPFRDTDDDVVRTAGKSIADVFFEDGESHFRDLERLAVTAALVEHPGVLSLGGGAVLSDEVRTRLAEHLVVLLTVDLANAARRVGLSRDRPVLAVNPRSQLRLLLEQRMPLYNEVADFAVDTSNTAPDHAVGYILGRIAPTVT